MYMPCALEQTAVVSRDIQPAGREAGGQQPEKGIKTMADEDTQNTGPLKGLRLIEMGTYCPLERFGAERYLTSGNMIKVSEEEGVGELFRRNVPGDEPIMMVRVINTTPEPDGTRKHYFIRVPPGILTAREAVAWTFGLETGEYRPDKET